MAPARDLGPEIEPFGKFGQWQGNGGIMIWACSYSVPFPATSLTPVWKSGFFLSFSQ